jgi:hypothetical protein
MFSAMHVLSNAPQESLVSKLLYRLCIHLHIFHTEIGKDAREVDNGMQLPWK